MASERQYFVTEEGLAALEKELEELKTVGRREVAEKIKVALSFGDLSENSEYDEAKNDQAMMEARIADLEVCLLYTSHYSKGSAGFLPPRKSRQFSISKLY